MASVWVAHLFLPTSYPLRSLSDQVLFRAESVSGILSTKWNRKVNCRKFVAAAITSDVDKRRQNDGAVEKSREENAKEHLQNPVHKLQEAISSQGVLVLSGDISCRNFTIGVFIVATIVVVVARSFAARKTRYDRPGSVADLVRRGQLKSDRRGILTPLKYEDPFNNPMVKVNKNNSTLEMCGKVYRMAPVTLTTELQTIHQKRRSRAYQWKRPTVFLREGESVPSDVDPDTVRWIPANHPFATTSSDIDEDLAQNNVYQKNGVPFRIQAEHEALQRKLEALQNEQKLNKLVIDPSAAREFERSQKTNVTLENSVKHGTSTSKLGSNPSTSDRVHFGNKSQSEEMRNI